MELYVKSFIDFDISFDNYSRTSAKIHDTAGFYFRFIWKRWFIEQVTNNCMMRKQISS
jgi:methionyl-tRNA synthetase